MAIRVAKDIAPRPTRERERDAEEALPEAPSQRKRPEAGRYSLQVDRQAKKSFTDLAAAEQAGAAIKKKFPVVQVMIYDTVDLTGRLIESA